ncbi:hypothetical protein [Methylorubrum populi]|uniref:DUF4381 domain-containing protein n=1 Tax=Methylorubrum populi TaxID=223967 RepID=A0A833MY90_9HYPH|nr:hypothetical protein [Methylorubrum populi]KAB7786022.1 hypothetical protein F8B43_1423 [Methylorubrum populi]
MNHDPNDSPAAQLDRYLETIEPLPRYEPKPVRWWQWLPTAIIAGGVIAIAARMLRLW